MAKIGSRNINPMIFEKTRDGEYLYDVYSRLIKERIVFLAEEIDSSVATTIAATLLLLDSQNSTKDICLYINSPGGTVCDGLFTIYDTMNFIKLPIQTVCIGEGMSSAAVILSAGTPGKRLAFANSHIMIHEVSSSMEGSGSTLEREAKQMKIIK